MTRLATLIAVAALCGTGAVRAQSTDVQPAPSDTPRSMPADVVPAAPASPEAKQPAGSPATDTSSAGGVASTREDVQTQTEQAQRERQMAHGEAMTLDEDKGAERAMTPPERGLAQ